MKSNVRENNNGKAIFLIAALLLTAFIIRLWHGMSYGFTNDELSALFRVRSDNLADLLVKGVIPDTHPPLVQVFLYYWTKLAGLSLLFVRMPFILAGTATVWVVYRAGTVWTHCKTASAIAAVFTAFSSYPILFSELARPYSFGMLFSTLTLLFWGEIFVRKQTSLRNFLLLGLWVLLSMYTHYYTFFFSGMVFASGFFFLSRQTYKNYILSGFLILLFYFPYLKTFLIQLGYKGEGGPGGWLGKPDHLWFFKYLFYVFSRSYLLVVVAVSGWISASAMIVKTRNYKLFLLPVWFFIAFFFGYFYSLWINPILQHSVLLFGYPALIIFTAYGLSALKKFLPPLLLVAIFILSVFAATDKSGFFRQEHFSRFDLPAKVFARWKKEYPEKSYSVFQVNRAYYIDYYLEDIPYRFDLYSLTKPGRWQEFTEALHNPAYKYLIFGWSAKQPFAEVYSGIRQHFPVIVEDHIYFNSRITLFARDSLHNRQNVTVPVYIEKIRKIASSEQSVGPADEYAGSLRMKNIAVPDSIPVLAEACVLLHSRDSLKGFLVLDILTGEGKKIWHKKNLSLFQNNDTVFYAFSTVPLPSGTKKIKKLKAYIWNNQDEHLRAVEIRVRLLENKEGYVYHKRFLKPENNQSSN